MTTIAATTAIATTKAAASRCRNDDWRSGIISVKQTPGRFDYHYFTWILEVFPALIGVALLTGRGA